ncbi:MAG: hypothetical protein AB1665_03980 [Candidatus Thermoplasmatota archaeon]
MMEIASKLGQLRHYVSILRGYQPRTLAEVQNDITLRGAVERYLGVAIECALDI